MTELRNLRKRDVRPYTQDLASLNKSQKGLIMLQAEPPHWRPKTRSDCIDGVRPCPYVGCKYNLYLDARPNGNIQFFFPDLEPDEMAVSCVLDVADNGWHTLEEVGELLNVTRERARQIYDGTSAKPEVREVLNGHL